MVRNSWPPSLEPSWPGPIWGLDNFHSQGKSLLTCRETTTLSSNSVGRNLSEVDDILWVTYLLGPSITRGFQHFSYKKGCTSSLATRTNVHPLMLQISLKVKLPRIRELFVNCPNVVKQWQAHFKSLLALLRLEIRYCVMFYNVDINTIQTEAIHTGWRFAQCFYFIAWASYQMQKTAGCACAGNAANVFPTTDLIGIS